ncbi:ferric reduction oxidase 2-like isoform X1 [Nicotiana tomentosiformis]|uniref:ferric reduction oxidase 2-like isoform X1 n=1 Tax=Nicotiana tomentosiformis TaxID=4098 RepID=UPI00051B3954|nr:ferric reduction oxidase 2-like isoform X1 [Nicotiana tomentosiformis]
MEVKKRSSSSSLSDGKIRMIQGAILALALTIFLGNLMMWVIMPTFTYYQKWVPALLAATNSTFFDIQGPIMMNFTLPILFIAVLGCIYVHLEKQKSDSVTSYCNKDWLKVLKKPKIMKPLGIVTWIELFFLAMFIILCVWYFSAFVYFHYSTITTYAATKGVQVWQARIDRLALVIGLTGNICLTFLFYPVSRGSSILPLLGLTSEGSIKYHIWLGHIAMTLFTIHGLLFILFWAVSGRLHEMLKWDPHYISNVPGEIGLLVGLILWITTFPAIRRRMFELFFYTHYLYILFMAFFLLHTGMFYACIMLPGFFLFLIDRYLRFLQSKQKVSLVSARVLTCETFELNFSKIPGLEYSPTSVMFLNVPSISKLQWHPFTVTSNSNLESDTISVVIKCEGSWTKKLYDVISLPSPVDRLEVSVEGPYGPASTHFLSHFNHRHDTLVLISGGSGITPFISIIRELIYMSSTLKCNTPKILLVSVFKNSSQFSVLDLLLPLSGTPSGCSNLDLQIEAYITRENEPAPEKPEPLRTVLFKPNHSDAPITPILGQNNWLWLAAIISSSFALYLLFVGLLYQYYVYPMDHGTNKVFPYHTRALFNMLFIAVSIVIAASAVFLWNKKKSARETKQIQDMADSTKSLNSLLAYADQELESLPQQSLNKSIKTYYGQRPDLKRILLEVKGASVGVVASGPKTLRHDVAAICSSGLVENLHFESISFTW